MRTNRAIRLLLSVLIVAGCGVTSGTSGDQPASARMQGTWAGTIGDLTVRFKMGQAPCSQYDYCVANGAGSYARGAASGTFVIGASFFARDVAGSIPGADVIMNFDDDSTDLTPFKQFQGGFVDQTHIHGGVSSSGEVPAVFDTAADTLTFVRQSLDTL